MIKINTSYYLTLKPKVTEDGLEIVSANEKVKSEDNYNKCTQKQIDELVQWLPSISNLTILSEPKAKAEARAQNPQNKCSHSSYIRTIYDYKTDEDIPVKIVKQYHSTKTPDEKGYLCTAEWDKHNSVLRLWIGDIVQLDELHAKYANKIDPSNVQNGQESLV